MSFQKQNPIKKKYKHSNKHKKILIVGAGIIGITIAFTLLSNGHQVTIIARDLPFDHNSTQFCSPWAGAIWLPFENSFTLPTSKWERESFLVWQVLKGVSMEEIKVKLEHKPQIQAKNRENTVEVYQTLQNNVPILSDKVLAFVPTKVIKENHQEDQNDDNQEEERQWSDPWFKDIVLDFTSNEEIQKFTTISIHLTNYLLCLFDQMSKKFGTRFHVYHEKVDSLFQAKVDFLPQADLIINCSGLGAKSLLDVGDLQVEPIRGQTVVIRRHNQDDARKGQKEADEFQCFFIQRKSSKSNQMTYGISRACSGEFLLGGSSEYGNYDIKPNQEQIDRIIKENVQFLPQFCSDQEDKEQTSGFSIVHTAVGLRPGRKGGARFELVKNPKGNLPPVIHAYGFGKTGFQVSWGVALDVLRLLNKI